MSRKITDEDIASGVAKVERMNKAFDKAIIPILFIAALAVFLFGALPRLLKNTKQPETQENTPPASYVDELTLYEKRSRFMDEIDLNIQKAQQAGYELMPEIQGTISILKQCDEQTVVAHFYTGISSYGKVIKEGLNTCLKADLQVYINGCTVVVTLKDGSRISAKFDSGSFIADETLTDTDIADRSAVLEFVTGEELSAMLELYDSELEALVK